MSQLLDPKPTTILQPDRLSRSLGIDVTLAAEVFQWTGSFKFRAARNVVAHVPNPHIIAASSGNFGQAIAFAATFAGKKSTIVMPSLSSKVKIEAVSAYGGIVDLVDTSNVRREDRVAELAALDSDAYVASAYDDPLVIEGNASLGFEIASLESPFDVVVAPVGGGGLTAGLATAFRASGYQTQLVGAEPAIANDAALSFRSGRLKASEKESETIADGARTRSLGIHNWQILSTAFADVVEVPESDIERAVLELFLLANLKVEPTGALSLGAILAQPEKFRGKRVLAVVSGGNVEPATYARLIGA